MTETFGERLRAARKQAKLSRELVAVRAGISAASVANYERGQRQPKVERLARALGCSVAHLVQTTPNPKE